MHPDEFDSELGVDEALAAAYNRFDRAMTEARQSRESIAECYKIVGHVAARDINNAAAWAEFGPDYDTHAERARTRAGYGVEQMEADSR